MRYLTGYNILSVTFVSLYILGLLVAIVLEDKVGASWLMLLATTARIELLSRDIEEGKK